MTNVLPQSQTFITTRRAFPFCGNKQCQLLTRAVCRWHQLGNSGCVPEKSHFQKTLNVWMCPEAPGTASPARGWAAAFQSHDSPAGLNRGWAGCEGRQPRLPASITDAEVGRTWSRRWWGGFAWIPGASKQGFLIVSCAAPGLFKIIRVRWLKQTGGGNGMGCFF